MDKQAKPKQVKKFKVQALCTAIFHIEIEATSLKEAESIAHNLTMLDDKYPTDNYDFDSDFRIASVQEITDK